MPGPATAPTKPLARARAGLPAWLRAFWPAPAAADWREQARVALGAVLGIFITGWLCHAAGGPSAAAAWPWLVAPMGASAVLVFGAPANPMAQPWAVVGGHAVSALVGVACVLWGGPPAVAAALAVGVAIGGMFALRCLHPPGGATALLMVLTGVADPAFVLYPVLANALLMVLMGMAYNHATRRDYPHRPLPAPAGARDAEAAAIDADLDAVLARHNHAFDIGRDELKALLEDAQLRSYQRKLANTRCGDIMSRQLITVGHGTPLAEAWALFGQHHIKALPVVDNAGGVVGIVTPADFVRHDAVQAAGQAGRWIGQIMTRKVRVARVDRHLVDLIPLFGGLGHHHLPIVEANGRLVGIVTQSDVVAALCRAGAAPAPGATPTP
ncbi:MAG: HPP family protein [Pseudomonadota bacterium]